MRTFHPPNFISFSSKQQDDECSCLTQLSDNEYPGEDFGIQISADPYFFHTLDKRHSQKTEKQELMELKIQVARQLEKIDLLESRLSQTIVENEELKF